MDRRDVTLIRKQAELEAAQLRKDPNIIYDDRIIKFSINLPLSLYAKITRKVRARYGGKRSVWIREVLENALSGERPVSFSQLIAEVEQRRSKRFSVVNEARFLAIRAVAWLMVKTEPKVPSCIDPNRRYHGVEHGLKVPSRWIAYRRRREKILDNSVRV